MPELEYNHEVHDNAQLNEQDKTLLVKFYIKERQDQKASQEAGRPIYKEVEYIDIKVPGQRDGVARPATFHDKQRFAEHYQAFKSRTDQEVYEGTPLLEWPLISRSMALELAFFNVKTVEHLAAMSDANAQKFPGIQAIKQKAVDWLEKAAGNAVEEKLRDELETATAKIQEQSALLEELTEKVKSLEEKEEGGF